MDKIVVTEAEFWAALEAAVNGRGEDYTYPQNWKIPGRRDQGSMICAYVHQTNGKTPEPGCIAGDVAHRLGADLRDLSRYEGKPASWVYRELFTITDGNTMGVLNAIDAAQSTQDEGDDWGAARIDARQSAAAEEAGEDA